MSSQDIQVVAEIINGILNPDNALRNASVQQLESLRQNTPHLILCLFKIMKEIQNPQTKLIASVLVSNILRIKDHEMTNVHWEKLSKEDRESIRSMSLEILNSEKDKKLKMKFCNLVHIIYDNSYETGETFNGVLEYVYKNLPLEINLENLDNIETAMELLSANFTYLDGEFMKIIDGFLQHFKNFLSTNILSLKTKTVKTVSEIVTYCDSDKLDIFKDFVLSILETTLRAFEFSDKSENELKECVMALNEIASSEPTLLFKHFNDIYILMTKIIEKTDYLDEKIRELAFDVIVNTVERSPKLFSKDAEKLNHFFELLYKYALELDTEIPDDWLYPSFDNYNEDETTTEEKPKTVFSLIYRLNETLTSKVVLVQIQKVIEKLFASGDGDFRLKYVALLSILEIANLIDNDMAHFENIFPIVYAHTVHENPKVRFAAVSCIKAFIICFGINYRRNHHETFLNLLLENIQNKEKVLRNQIEIINTLIVFYDGCPQKIGALYLERILATFIQVFLNLENANNVSNLMRRQILKLITKLVRSSKENITPYAEKILDILLQLFNNFYMNKTNSELYGDFLECIVLVGPYAQSAYFTSLPNLVSVIIEVQNNIPVATDPIRNSLESVYKNLIPILKENSEFKGLLPEVIKSVLILVKNLPVMSLSGNPQSEFSIENILNEETDSGENKSKMIKSIQTSSTEDITSAIKLLKTAIKSLKEEYIPYIEITQNEVFSLMNYKINENVRIQAVKILHHLVEIVANNSTKENLASIAKNYLSKIIESIESEFDNSAMLMKIKHLGKIVLKSEYFLSKEELYSFFRKLTNLIDEIEKRRINLVKEHEKLQQKKTEKNLLAQKQGKQIAEEENDEDEFEEQEVYDPEKLLVEDIQEIEDIQGFISDVIGYVFKTHKNISQEIAECIIKEWIPKYLKENSSAFEIKMAILIIDDMIEYLGQDFLGQSLWTEMGSILIKYTNYSDCKIRRAANYGVGILAQNTQKDFSIFAENALNALANSLQIQIETRNESEWGGAKDNATASLGKMLKYQSNFVNLENCFHLWLRNLPIVYDETESIEQHTILCDFLLNKPEFAYGANLVNLDHIIRVFVKIHSTENYSNEDIDAKIRTIVAQWKQNEQFNTAVENIKNSSENSMKKKITKLMQI